MTALTYCRFLSVVLRMRCTQWPEVKWQHKEDGPEVTLGCFDKDIIF